MLLMTLMGRIIILPYEDGIFGNSQSLDLEGPGARALKCPGRSGAVWGALGAACVMRSSPISVLKNGERHLATTHLFEGLACRSEPVPVFQRTDSPCCGPLPRKGLCSIAQGCPTKIG